MVYLWFFSFFYCVLLGGLNISPEAQTLIYGIYRGDEEIGEIVATINATNETVQYMVNSDVNFRVFWKYNRTTDLEVIYCDNILISSFNQIHLNDKLKEQSEVRMVDGLYHCFSYPSEFSQQKTEIVFSAGRLFFDEPIGFTKVYSENYLEFVPLEDVGNHMYKLTLPGDRINQYRYQDGKLMEVMVNRTWFSLVFKRKSV